MTPSLIGSGSPKETLSKHCGDDWPSNTIRLQTVEALKNTEHPYRAVLDEAFQGRVRMFDIVDFIHIRPHDIRGHCCIVVGTIQTLRVSNTEGRKVYAHNEEMEPHFSSIPMSSPGLERLEGGGVKFSFANLMYVHRPPMIVDEAHNAVTGLTHEMQARVNPCTIVRIDGDGAGQERASAEQHPAQRDAQELKLAEMIKLPVMLSEHDRWQNAVTELPIRVAPRLVLEIQHKDRLLADPGAVEDVLAVENDVVPLNGANMVE